MPRNTHGPTPLLALEAVVLDTEATALDVRKARVVQIACVRLHSGAIDESQGFETLVNPGRPVPTSATVIHGITDAMVADAPTFGQIAERLERFIGPVVIMGHGLAYDLAVLRREYQLAGRAWPRWRALDVFDLARIAAPSLADYSLDRLCQWLEVDILDRHTALGDATAAAELFLRLVPLLRSRNIRTLAEAEASVRELVERELLLKGRLPMDGEKAGETLTRIDNFPYRYRVSDVMTAPPVFAERTATVMQAARLMVDKGVSSVFVRCTSNATGIVTERDILRAVAVYGDASASLTVDSLTKAPLQTIQEDAFVYRAIARLQRLGFRHLGVEDGQGRLVGALTTRNLLRDPATPAVVLGDEIDSAATPAELASAWAKLLLVARSLTADEVDPRTLSSIVSSEICGMTRRAAQLAEKQLSDEGHGPPPAPYAVLVLGSAGRGESQLAADQDNAIVYGTGTVGGPEDIYFERLGVLISETLDAAGVAFCKGGVMAKNRAWRKSRDDWCATIDGWIGRQRPEDLLNVDIFFDAVPVHGDFALGTDIWRYAYDRGYGARDFQNLLVEMTRRRESAFTFLGRFRVDSSNRIDLKKLGLMPIFTSARVLSIRHNLQVRSTPDRLKGAQAAGVGSPEIVEAVLDAQQLLLGTVIAQQLKDAEAGLRLSTRVELRNLDGRTRSRLKQALQAVDQAVDLVAEGRI